MGRKMACWYEDFNRFAGDLYPGLYTREYCKELAEKAEEILVLAKAKRSKILAHFYLRPEFHETAHKLGDSLALSSYAKQERAERVDFQAVFFMGATAKIITGDNTRVFVSDSPQVLGCSLVFGTAPDWIENWKRHTPEGIVITYVNSGAYIK